MKKLILMAAMMIGCMCAMAQDLYHHKSGKYTLTINAKPLQNDTVIQFENPNKEEVYENIKKYMDVGWSRMLAKKTITHDDKENFRLLGSFIFDYTNKKEELTGTIDAKYEIIIRDGRLRFILTDYEHRAKYKPEKYSCGKVCTEIPYPCPCAPSHYSDMIKILIPRLEKVFDRFSLEIYRAASGKILTDTPATEESTTDKMNEDW